MKLKTKTSLANISIWIIVVTMAIIAIFFFGFLISNTFDLIVFANRTSTFIWTLFGASLVIVICGAFLNISLNIGIIADGKINESSNSKVEKNKTKTNKRLIFIVLMILIVMSGSLFLGDFLTRQNEKNILVEQCEETLTRYEKSIEEISTSLSDTALIGKIPDILKFLEEQKEEFPNIILITSDFYQGQMTYLKITPYMSKKDLKKELYNFTFYSCDQNDCEYLNDIFSTNKSEYYFWTENSNYRLYYPIVKGEKKYILLFSKYDRYGKIGS
jgi:NADH:ubiquinone oxidoreductase subunit 5 (subunit L)/multisubunit Na+/H+ antiporter MnhA subunit